MAQSHFLPPEGKGNDSAFKVVRGSDGGACSTLPAGMAPVNHRLVLKSKGDSSYFLSLSLFFLPIPFPSPAGIQRFTYVLD